MFANLTPPDGLTSWLASATFLVVLVVHLLKARQMLAGKPSAAEVDQKSAEKYVSKTDFLAHKQGVHAALAEIRGQLKTDADKILAKLDEVKDDLSSASERRIQEVHRRLDEVNGIAIRAEDRTKHLRHD